MENYLAEQCYQNGKSSIKNEITIDVNQRIKCIQSQIQYCNERGAELAKAKINELQDVLSMINRK